MDCVRHGMPAVVRLGNRVQSQKARQTGEAFGHDNPE
jgi:hypothetical protein